MNDENTFKGADKVKQYGWVLRDVPGDFRQLRKEELRVDLTYQRDTAASNEKLLNLARDWSWVACGVLVVAERAPGDYFVIDGQHRLLAARKRSDIQQLPCLVFPVADVQAEAKGFLAVNTARRPLRTYDKFNALLVTGDAVALRVDALLRQAGRIASGVAAANTVRCLQTIMDGVRLYPDATDRIWPLVSQVCEGHPFHERIFSGLLHIEARLPPEVSLMAPRHQARVLSLGYQGLLDAAARAVAFHASGGAGTWAAGMLQAINQGRRTPLTLRSVGPEKAL